MAQNAILIIVLPVLAAFLLPVVERISTLLAAWFGPLLLLLVSALGVQIWMQMGNNAFAVELGGFAPPLGIPLYVDQLALFLALSVSVGCLLLWPAAGAGTRERTLVLLLAGSGAGLALSGDLFNIYVFYELVSVVSFGLTVVRGTPASWAAALRYLILSSFAAALALAGIALIYQATGTLNLAHLAQLAPQHLHNTQGLTAFVLLLAGFGVKAELFPFNGWVPEVYAVAPRRVAALLAGVVSKLALLIILRILVLLFPYPEAHVILLVLGVLGILTAELAAWRAPDLTRMLAFSSIGQLGILFVAFSIPGKAGVVAGLAVGLHHLLVKPALFLLAERWGGAVSDLAGAAKRSPFAAGLFLLFALSLIGVPPLPGFWAKLLVLEALVTDMSLLQGLAMTAILIGAVLEANYLLRVFNGMLAEAGQKPVAHHRAVDLGLATVMGLVLVAAVVLLPPLNRQLQDIAQHTVDVERYIDVVNPQPLQEAS